MSELLVVCLAHGNLIGMRVASLRLFWIAFVTAFLSLVVQLARAQLPSFSGAEGFGGTFTGSPPAGGWFSDASVYHVTTTQDLIDSSTGKPAIGTLRGAFYDYTNPSSPKQHASNRIVVFDVGGTFELTNGSLDIKSVNNIYVAGQTAPTPVTVFGDLSQITASSNTTNSNVILRYLTFRKGTGDGDDAITFKNGGASAPSNHMIIDHVSASWSEDEVLSVANFNTDVTVQYSMMTDSLTSGHQYGSLIRPETDAQITFHHNLYGNDKSRNPRVGSYNNKALDLDFRNNVVYNYSDRAGYTGGASETDTEYVNMNYVGNYIIAGPATPTGQKSNTAFTMDVSSFYNLATNSVVANPKDYLATQIYQSGNQIDSNHNAVRDGMDTGWGMFIASDGSTIAPYPDFNYGPNSSLPAKSATPFNYPAVTTQPAGDAYDQVMNYVGNWWWNRDAIDARIIYNVENNTQPPGGIPATAPVPSELSLVTSAASPAAPTTHPANWDSDGDGMPNWWEIRHGLDANSAADGKLDFDSDGYTNVQEYLDEIGAFPAPTPIVFNGATSNRYAVITNWKTNDGVTGGSSWQPSRFDEAQIDSGTVVVDAVGQHAGVLIIAANSGNNATLNITSGWLKVNNDVIVTGATAALNLSGGTLSTQTLSKGNGGSFTFIGGELNADTINFSLVNTGGTLAPGDSIGETQSNTPATNIGQTHVVGDLMLTSGTLQIELSSLALFDKLFVDGTAALGGSLTVSTLDGFTPASGDSWQIITAGGIGGEFENITAGYSVQKRGNSLLLFFGTPTLAGDYNGDGKVDAADYVVWRHALATGGTLLNETASPNEVDAADYDAWSADFGATTATGSGSASASSTVPEPTSALLVAVVAVIGPLAKKRARYGDTALRVFGSFLQKYLLG
ncbi:MAG TPA: hypothetical protein VHE81_10885 [Lacipirellulaceae bacterium]|nr:hypothetical protein [Lacipirellulaceae bacterium]